MPRMNFDEFYGVKNLMVAPITIDSDGNEVFGTPKRLSGVQTVAKEVSESAETHYYDNQGAVIVSSEGDDTYTLTVSVVDNETRAMLDGVEYNSNTDTIIGTKKRKRYFAIGFIADTVNNVEKFFWIYKGTFTPSGITYNTKSDSIETSNDSYTFTSVHTTREFGTYGAVKYIGVDSKSLIDKDKFFAKVILPSEVTSAYYDPMETSVLTIPTGDEDVKGKTASELMSNVEVKSNGAVVGNLLYVTGYTGYSENVDEQSGHFFACTLAQTGTLMSIKKNGIYEKENVAFDATLVLRVTSTDDEFEVSVDGNTVTTFKFGNVLLMNV